MNLSGCGYRVVNSGNAVRGRIPSMDTFEEKLDIHWMALQGLIHVNLTIILTNETVKSKQNMQHFVKSHLSAV